MTNKEEGVNRNKKMENEGENVNEGVEKSGKDNKEE